MCTMLKYLVITVLLSFPAIVAAGQVEDDTVAYNEGVAAYKRASSHIFLSVIAEHGVYAVASCANNDYRAVLIN